MEIITHVLTNPQNGLRQLESDQQDVKASKSRRRNDARLNIGIDVTEGSEGKAPIVQGIKTSEGTPLAIVDGVVTLPAGTVQEQSNWAQTDPHAVSYIQNKPDNLVQDADYQHTDNNFTDEDKSKLDTAYQMPEGGVPKSDLAQVVQDSLDLADTALQEHQDISGKADKVEPVTAGDIATLDASGNLTDSGKTISDFVQTVSLNDGNPVGPDQNGNVNLTVTTEVDDHLDDESENPVQNKVVTEALGTKLDKVSGATEGNFAVFDANGNLTDDGIDASDFATAAQGALADTAYQKPVGGIPKSDLAQGVQDSLDLADTALQEHQDISGKADKVSGATEGNFAVFDANGNLADDGIDASDFATAAQGALADTAYQKPGEGIPKTDLAQGVQDSLDLADTALQEHQDISGKADKVSSATEGNFAIFDANGNLADDGINASDFATAAQGALADTAYQKPGEGIPKNDLAQGVKDSLDLADSAVQPADLDVYALKSEMSVTDGSGADADKVTIQLKAGTSTTVLKSHQDITGKADKVSGATNGNFAGLDANGNLTDSQRKASDFATAAQGAKADSAIQGIKVNGGTEIVPGADNVVDIEVDSIVPPENNGEWIWSDEKDSEGNEMGWRQIVRDYVGNLQRDENDNPILDENDIPLTDESDAQDAVKLWLSYKQCEFAARRAYEDETGANIHDSIESRTTMAQVIAAIETALANYGGFKVVPLVNGVPDPSPDLPSEKFIYLTKESQSQKTDPYTEWIWIAGTPDGRWDCIGETSIDLTTKADKVSGAIDGHFAGLDSTGNLTDSGKSASDFASASHSHGAITNDGKVGNNANYSVVTITDGAVTAVSLAYQSPSVSAGSTLTVIESVSQDSKGQISAVTKTVQDGTTSQKGVVQLDATISSSTTTAATPSIVESAYNLADSKYTLPSGGIPKTDLAQGVQDSLDAADTAYQKPSGGIPKTDLAQGVQDSLGAADTAIQGVKLAGASSVLTPDQDNVVTIPNAVPTGTGETNGLMSASDKDKLDGIEAGADVNLIESISVNGTAVQPDANKNVDITVPTVNDGELSITVGSSPAVTFTANQSSNASVTVPLASKDTSGATPVYTEGLMTSAQNEKLDNIVAFSTIDVTSGSTTGHVEAESDTETLNLVAGDNITLTADNTTKTIEISASLGADLGFLSGSATVNGIVNNGDVLTDPLTGVVSSSNGRFIIGTDSDDGHVYLYALRPTNLVNGVDLFTISVNSNVSRTTANGFYGVAGLEIRHKDNGNSLITESTESYASQVGECSVDLTVTIKNSTGIPKEIDGVDYYGYLIRYAGDSTASGDAINVVTRISVIEETVGIVEYNGSQSSLSAGNGISIDNDTINANLGDGLGLDSNNNIEVKVGAGLKIDTTGGVATVAIDNVTEEVVETVQKLGEDLDKKITTTFPYAQITTMSDFMTYGTQGENRMFGQLFSVPITSELRVDDTVICVNALQSAPSIDVVFGIFEYDFSANNGSGSTYWLADTGVVHVSAGDNAFPIKNLINDVTRPSIEMKSSCLYYAVWAIHNTGASNGLVLASCPGYGANYNAIPRYTVKTSGASVQVNWAGDGCLRNSWFSGYNEDNSIPRLFMMVRNKSDIQPSGNDPFIDITDYELNDQYTINQIFGSTAPSAGGAVFQKVIPARAVNITKFEWADTKSTVTATSSSPMVMDNSFGTTLTLADGTLTTAQDGDYYVHTFTPTNALAMTAGTVYWLPAQYNTVAETGMSDGGDNKLVQYSTNVARRDLQMIVDMAQPSGTGEFKASQTGVYLKLYDDNNNSWVI